MGIRVRKALGYALTDLKAKKAATEDPRVDPRGYLGDPESDRWSFTNYVKFLKDFTWPEPNRGRRKRVRPLLEDFMLTDDAWVTKAKNAFPHRVVEHDSEFGLARVLLVTPTCFADEWSRRDDALDWCEESQRAGPHGPQNRVVELGSPPYPWNVNMEDTRTGKLVPEVKYRMTSFKDRSRLEPTWRWIVPAEVAAVCKFFRLFRKDETIRTMKPVLYVWWA